jgi:hypothetical protein
MVTGIEHSRFAGSTGFAFLVAAVYSGKCRAMLAGEESRPLTLSAGGVIRIGRCPPRGEEGRWNDLEPELETDLERVRNKRNERRE